jgi:2-polyprenyl-3-methyl-5-hydroxy-6-metoxy-1,4-benzoquinol methylase
MEFTGERVVPWSEPMKPWANVWGQHMERYAFACMFAGDKDVLDAACGSGFGSLMLSAVAKSITGFDIDPETTKYTSDLLRCNQYKDFEISERDLQDPIPVLRQFDLVVSFETIEHLEFPEKWVNQIPGLLKPGGVFVGSVPLCDNLTAFHKHTFTRESFIKLVEDAEFTNVNFKLQEGGYGIIWATV